jgi:Na+/H+ antiporter NhaD/arsenite permease-like protein
MQTTPWQTILWGFPFLGLLLSIAILPGLAPRFWVRRMGTVALGWTLLLLVPVVADHGVRVAWPLARHVLIQDYLPFISLLGALYIAAGGILVRGGPRGTPGGNTVMLASGMVLGLVMGTSGAAMVLVHPLLAANAHRRRKTHLVLFLIVLVANASGALTPLGNPPLFVGLLRGVPFLWPAEHLLAPYLVLTGTLLTAFYLLDRYLAAGEPPAPATRPLRVRGWWNVALVAVLGVSVLAQSLDLPEVSVLGEHVDAGRLGGIAVALAAAAVSLWITPRTVRGANDFSWHPMAEVAILFLGIFVTLAPVSAMLRAGAAGPLAPLFALTRDAAGDPWPLAYFWLTGLLSAVLDNAPTYLVFFDLAGIQPGAMGPDETRILRAISAGAVFFGGLTYIGNAPNMMLRAVASHRGVRMPGFFGFSLLAAAVSLPVFVLLTLLFFG